MGPIILRHAKAHDVLREKLLVPGDHRLMHLQIPGRAHGPDRDRTREPRPRAYGNPARLDIVAPRGRSRQLVLVGGIHTCLGVSMARLEMEVALTTLTQLGQPSVAGPVTWLPHTAAIHGPVSLPMQFAGASR